MTYSLYQLYQLALNAGFRGQDAVTAAAIAEAESGGNPTSYNPETQAGTAPGKGSYGLWQVYLTDHPGYSPAYLDTPQGSATAAYQIYQQAGNSFSPWSTYKNGAYQPFLQQLFQTIGGTMTLGSQGGQNVGAAVGNAAANPSTIQGAITNAVQTLTSDLTLGLRLGGWLLLAFIIMGAGLWLVIPQQTKDAANGAIAGVAKGAAKTAALAAG